MTTIPTNSLRDAMNAVDTAVSGLTTTVVTPATTLTVKLPPGTERYANDVRRFVDAMLFKLGQHQGKGRWEDMDIDQALKLLAGEYRELHEAAQFGNTIGTILEAADVANYAMIISSIVMDSGK